MLYVFYFFAAVLIWLSFKSFISGLRYLRYFREEIAKTASNFTPAVTIIAPCRGVDRGLAANLEAVLAQDYPNFEIVFVVDDILDPAVAAIYEVLGRQRKATLQTKIVVAPKAAGCSQKVENLREGVRRADPTSAVFVFVDSDARPSTWWLRTLVARLEDEKVGVATGYRWFISEERSFASELLSVWNASIASALSPTTSSFCWGGSTAIRREVFERLEIHERWRGVVADDFALADAVKKAGMDIVFVPQALTASFERPTLAGLLEFTNRQMKLTRVYATPLWLVTFVGCGVFTAVMLTAFLIAMLSKQNGPAAWISIGVIVLVSLMSIGKAWLRFNAVRLALPQYADELRRQFLPQTTLWLISPALFFINSLAALFSRRITWRGITYELKSPTETVIIAPNNAKHL